jgi:predicted site-specific integrase-resolvase
MPKKTQADVAMNQMRMKAVIYARVSSKEQEKKDFPFQRN